MAQTLYLRRGAAAHAARMSPPTSLVLVAPDRQQIIDARSSEDRTTSWALVLDGQQIGTCRSYSEAVERLNQAVQQEVLA